MAKHAQDNGSTNAIDTMREVDTEFVSWMTQHEASYRNSWVFDEIWADQSVPLLPTVLIVSDGVVTENYFMDGIMGKWQKIKVTDSGSFVGTSIGLMTETLPQYKFVARRARNTMSGETLFYAK